MCQMHIMHVHVLASRIANRFKQISNGKHFCSVNSCVRYHKICLKFTRYVFDACMILVFGILMRKIDSFARKLSKNYWPERKKWARKQKGSFSHSTIYIFLFLSVVCPFVHSSISHLVYHRCVCTLFSLAFAARVSERVRARAQCVKWQVFGEYYTYAMNGRSFQRFPLCCSLPAVSCCQVIINLIPMIFGRCATMKAKQYNIWCNFSANKFFFLFFCSLSFSSSSGLLAHVLIYFFGYFFVVALVM